MVSGKQMAWSLKTIHISLYLLPPPLTHKNSNICATVALCIHTCMDLQATALAVEQRGGAVFLQQWVSGSRGAILLPKRKADLWDQGLASPKPSTMRWGTRHWRWRLEGVFSYHRLIVLCFVFRLGEEETVIFMYKNLWQTKNSKLSLQTEL